MVTVRTVDTPRVQQAATPNADIGVRASASSFGADIGTGIQNLATGLDRAAEIRQREKDKQNLANQNSKLLELDTHAQDVLRNPETGYLLTEGENALDGYAKTFQSFDDKRDQLASDIQDPEVRKRFIEKADARRLTYGGSVNTHAGRKRRELFVKNHSAVQANELNRQMENYADPDYVGLSMGIRLENEAENMLALGVSPESEEGKLRIDALKQESYVGVISTALNNLDPDIARKYLSDKGIREAIGVNQVAEFERQLGTATSLKSAQDLATSALSDPEAQDINTLGQVELETINAVRKGLSGEQEEIAIRQVKSQFADQRRLLSINKNAQADLAKGAILGAQTPAEALSIVAKVKVSDPVLGAELEAVVDSKILGDKPETKLNRIAAGQLISKVEAGEFDSNNDIALTQDQRDARIEIEGLNMGLTFSQIDAAKKAGASGAKDATSFTSVQNWARRYQTDDDFALPVDVYDAITEELTSLTGGKRKATEAEVQAATAKYYVNGYTLGTNLIGTDDDNETLADAIQSGNEHLWRPYISDTERLRLGSDLRDVLGPDVPVTEEMVTDLRRQEILTGNNTAAAIDALTIEINAGTSKDPMFTALPPHLQKVVNSEERQPLASVRDSVIVMDYDRKHEKEADITQRRNGYPSNLPDPLRKKLDNAGVWWDVQAKAMANIKKANPSEYNRNLNEMQSLMPDYALAIDEAVQFIINTTSTGFQAENQQNPFALD